MMKKNKKENAVKYQGIEPFPTMLYVVEHL